MNIRILLLALLSASFSFAAAPPSAAPPVSESSVDNERLVLVYAHLKNAEQVATGGVVLSNDDLLTSGRTMTREALKKECGALVDKTLAAVSSAPTNRRPETMAYMKDAMLRLTLNREEPHAGHVSWAQANRDKVSLFIRNYAKAIKDALTKI